MARNKYDVDEILEDIKAGKIVVMIDDEERENQTL
jgi:3,4-dihydroxy-2-butanone 4-phosphate synthase